MRRATIVVCANSGTEVPRYGVCVSATTSQFVDLILNPTIIRDEPKNMAKYYFGNHEAVVYHSNYLIAEVI